MKYLGVYLQFVVATGVVVLILALLFKLANYLLKKKLAKEDEMLEVNDIQTCNLTRPQGTNNLAPFIERPRFDDEGNLSHSLSFSALHANCCSSPYLNIPLHPFDSPCNKSKCEKADQKADQNNFENTHTPLVESPEYKTLLTEMSMMRRDLDSLRRGRSSLRLPKPCHDTSELHRTHSLCLD